MATPMRQRPEGLAASLTAASARPDAPVLDAQPDLVAGYLDLTTQRREIEERLATVRAELELIAADALTDAAPRGRFVAPSRRGSISARLQATCLFNDKQRVARELQRMGRLADVAVLQGPMVARYLTKEPVVAARLADHVRRRHRVVLMAAQG